MESVIRRLLGKGDDTIHPPNERKLFARTTWFHEALQAMGINHVFYTSPDTGHEWHTWRRSLHEFAPLLFNP